MRTTGLWLLLLIAGVGAAFGAAPNTAVGARLPPAEARRVELLLQAVGRATDLVFVRNGVAYDAASAAQFLQMKWTFSSARIATAEDFVREVGSQSGTSGLRYRVRYPNGSEEDSAVYLGRLLSGQPRAP